MSRSVCIAGQLHHQATGASREELRSGALRIGIRCFRNFPFLLSLDYRLLRNSSSVNRRRSVEQRNRARERELESTFRPFPTLFVGKGKKGDRRERRETRAIILESDRIRLTKYRTEKQGASTSNISPPSIDSTSFSFSFFSIQHPLLHSTPRYIVSTIVLLLHEWNSYLASLGRGRTERSRN